ncbi:hypothetical protein [Actinoplanes sp. N902-109]|uniref:hypothetical protein n=1 Tax=Actinoplanes sp. (strain N902-109) TaxID=649831 RepID=UPI0003293752|nr:hypothetical protein [Actinoplanes sp. N902-109]AGL19871.1 hypothetical protein L083_6361 [Actinoplanes sp. N902-109]
MSADSVAAVKREILVRHLETWAPGALRRGRRATYVHGYADADPTLTTAALEVFADESYLARGRELTVIALGEPPEVKGLSVLTVAGDPEATAGVALKAAGASRVPLLGVWNAAPGPGALAALATGKPAEIVAVLPAGTAAPELRATLHEAGFPLVAEVELAVSDEPGEILVYGTTLGKHLEAFKDLLWAVDEYAGVRYRDPGDPERHLIDISLSPHPGPLRRELLARLVEVGSATVTELRTYALTDTVYRASDATRVLHALLDAGAVTRRPADGRLGGDVVISPGA